MTDLDGLGEGQHCYGKASPQDIEPVAGALERRGYRLPTDREFLLACRAATTTRRYYGDSSSLLRNYAWFEEVKGLRSHPVGQLKPNELGLFDMLGNAHELCEVSGVPENPRFRAIFCGGSAAFKDLHIYCEERTGPTTIDQRLGVDDVGFRLARTVRPVPRSTE